MNVKALLKALMFRKFPTALLITQLALCLGLLVNSIQISTDTLRKLNIDIGLDVDNLLYIKLLPTSAEFKHGSLYRSVTTEDLLALRNIEGVRTSAFYNQLPLMATEWKGNIQDNNLPKDGVLGNELSQIPFFFTDENGVKDMGVKLIQGRDFESTDDFSIVNLKGNDRFLSRNIIVTQSLSKALFPDRSALGRLTNMGRIVGITKDIIVDPKLDGRKNAFAVFVNQPLSWNDGPLYYLLQVEQGYNDKVSAKVHETLRKVHQEREILEMGTLKLQLSDLFKQESSLATLFVLLSILMISVTAISCFSHSHFHVSQQAKYIGIRRALGATKGDILLYVISENGLLTITACIVGVIFTLVLNSILSIIIHVDVPKILYFVSGCVVIVLCGFLASLLPAIKTANISPLLATKSD